jgi:hypothetical protein
LRTTSIGTRKLLVDWIFSIWGSRVVELGSLAVLQSWLVEDTDYTRVVAFGQNFKNMIRFRRVASDFSNVRFAALSADGPHAIRKYWLQSYPTFLLFRSATANDTTHQEIELDGIERLSGPVFARLKTEHLLGLCFEKCIVHIGQPSKKLRLRLELCENLSLTWVPEKSNFALALGARDQEVFQISGKAQIAIEIDPQALANARVQVFTDSKQQPLPPLVDGGSLIDIRQFLGMIFATPLKLGGWLIDFVLPEVLCMVLKVILVCAKAIEWIFLYFTGR